MLQPGAKDLLVKKAKNANTQEGGREGGRDQERDQNPVASWAEGLPRHRRRKPYYQTHLGRGDVLQPRAVVFPYLLGHTTSFLTEPLA